MRLNLANLLPQIVRDQNGIPRYISLEQVFIWHFLTYNIIVVNGNLSKVQTKAISSIPTIINNELPNRINEMRFVENLYLENNGINDEKMKEIFPTVLFMLSLIQI